MAAFNVGMCFFFASLQCKGGLAGCPQIQAKVMRICFLHA